MNRYVGWFRWAMLLGFVMTVFLAVPGIFRPAAVADLVGARPPADPVWPAFGFLLSFLISWFYIPAALHPLEYLPTAWIAVLGRFVLAVFWIFGYGQFEPGPIWPLAIAELAFGIVQFVLLVLAVRTPSVPVA